MSVTVIIPTYNSSSTIERTLRSVLKQTEAPAEIIIIDDASTDFDELTTVVRRLEHEGGVPFVLLRNLQNMNGAASRNRGIEAARSQFIAFLDADDQWEPEKLQISLDILRRRERRCFVYSQVQIIRDNVPDVVRPTRPIGIQEHMSEYLFLSGGFVQTSSIVCCRTIADEIRFNPAYRRHQDYDFCLRAAAAGIEPVFIDQPLVRYHAAAKIFGKRIEDPNYSRNWAMEMRPYMSRDGYYGFRFFLLTARLMARGARLSATMNALGSAMMLGPSGLWKARHKAQGIASRLFRRQSHKW